MSADLAQIRLTIERAEACHEQILELVERLVELNVTMWDHHLRFCGQLTEKVATAEKEVLDIRGEVRDEIEAVRQAVRGNGRNDAVRPD